MLLTDCSSAKGEPSRRRGGNIMERIWLKNYPPGVPAEIDPTLYSSLVAMLDESFHAHRGKDAFVCMGKTVTYDELESSSRALGAWLQSAGLKKGARVAIMLPNILQNPIAMFGALRAGMTVVNVNPLYTPRELEFQLKDSGAEAIVVLENFAHTLADVIARTSIKHVIVASMGDLLGVVKGTIVNLVVRRVKKMVPPYSLPGAHRFNEVLAVGGTLPLHKLTLGPDDIAFLQYTGGTTGVSKGAILSHRNVVANTLQANAWLEPALMREPRVDQLFMVAALPLYHIFALNTSLVYMKIGCESVLIANPRDLDGFVKALSSRRWSVLTGVNTLFNSLLNHPEFAKIDFSNMKLTVGGGMAVQRAVAERWKKVTGKPVVEAYGLTETSPAACANPVNLAEFNGCIGLPICSTMITIRDDDENIVASGQPGEICIDGPQVMLGYWQRPEETAKVMTKDGAFKSGDIGVMDDKGFFKIVDRKKDMILVSGFNVYPNEIEDVVALCPGVLEVCAVAAPDEKSGEVVRVVVVRKDPALTKEIVMTHCKANLTGYKLPRIIEFWSELPKTNVGKILRREVKSTPVKS